MLHMPVLQISKQIPVRHELILPFSVDIYIRFQCIEIIIPEAFIKSKLCPDNVAVVHAIIHGPASANSYSMFVFFILSGNYLPIIIIIQPFLTDQVCFFNRGITQYQVRLTISSKTFLCFIIFIVA